MTDLKELRFLATFALEFKNIKTDDETKYSTFYPSSKAETVINKSDINDAFESVCNTIISNIQKSLGKDSSCITDSVTDHIIKILKHKPWSDSSYIKLPKKLNHPKNV